MTDPIEKLTPNPTQFVHRMRRIPTVGLLERQNVHRVRLICLPELPERQTIPQMPTTNELSLQGRASAPALFDPAPEEATTRPLLALEQQERAHRELQQRLLKPRTSGYDGVAASKLQARSTLPTLPFVAPKGGSGHQEPTEHATNAEISGAAGNAAIIGFGNIAGYLFKYGNNLVIQRALGVELFGLYSVSLSLVTLISSIFDLGLDNAMIRYIAIYRGQKRQTNSIRSLVIFCTSLVGITGILGALLVLVMAPFLAKLVNKPDAAPLLQIMAPLIPLLCMQTVWTGGLQGLKEFKKRVLIQRFLVPLLLLLLVGVALIFFRNAAGVAAFALLSAMISAMINLNFLFRAVSRISDWGDEKYEVRTWLSFALPNFLTTVVNTLLDSIDTLLLAFFVSNAQIGQYTAAIKISLFILLPLTSLNIVFTPTIAELYARKAHQKLASMFQVVTKWTITLSLPIFAIVTLFSVPLLELSGKSFSAAWPLLIALATGYMISAATGSVGYMLLMTGHQKFSLFNSAATIILNIVLGIILTPRYGAMGTAISTGLAISVINGIRLLEVYLVLKMFPYRWDVLKPLGAGFISALLTGALLYLLNRTHFTLQLFHLHLSIQLALVPVFLTSYTLLLTLFKINPEDKIVLNKLGTKFGRGKK